VSSTTYIWGSIGPGSGSGPGGTGLTSLGSYATYSALTTANPPTVSLTDKVAFVSTSTGVYLINRKNKGWYRCNGTSWDPLEYDDLALDALAKHLTDFNHNNFSYSIDNLLIVQKTPGPGQFLTIEDALASITDNSSTNTYGIYVGPGIWTAPQLNCKPYVSIFGASIQSVIVEPDANNHHVFNLVAMSELSFMTIRDAGPGYSGIMCDDIGDFGQVHKVSMFNNDTHITVISSTQDTVLYLEYVDINGVYTKGVNVVSNGFIAKLNTENWYTYPDITNTGPDLFGTGPDCEIEVRTSTFKGQGTSIGIQLEDGAKCNVGATSLVNYLKAVNLPNIGAAQFLDMTGSAIKNSTVDLQIDHPTAVVRLVGAYTHSKIINSSSNLSYNFLDKDNGTVEVTNKINMLFPDGTHTDLSTLIIETSTSGAMEGGELSDGGGFTVNVAEGFGYYETFPDDDVIHKLEWSSSSIVLSANVDKYIYFDNNGVLSADASLPSSIFNIILGRVVTNSSGIEFIDPVNIDAEHSSNRFADLLREGVGPIFNSGASVSEHATPYRLVISGGTRYFGTTKLITSGGSPVVFDEFCNGSLLSSAATIIQANKYDNGGGGLTTIPSGKYAKHSLFVVGDLASGTEKYLLVYGQTTYTTLLLAQNADLPVLPSSFKDGVTIISNIIVQQGSANIIEFQDARPRIGFKALGTSASSDHQSLLNRSDPAAHNQYLLRNGGNAASANLDLGGFTLINTGILPGTTTAAPVTQTPDQSNTEGVSANKARADHIHNIPTDVPVSIGTNNLQGTGVKFAKNDHVHNHGNQTNENHHALAVAGVSHGFISKTDQTKLDSLSNSYIWRYIISTCRSYT
jgi:hypothetical protein